MRRRRLSGCTPTKMFSATLRSGNSVGSWKMIAIPAACDCFALSKIASSPSSRSRPPSGRWTPARILTSVDLPAPFSPTRPCTSPARSSMWPSSSACTAPKLFCACSTTSTGSGFAAELKVLLTVESARASETPPGGREPPGAAPHHPGLELELVDVRDVEDEGRSEDHLRASVRALDDGVRPELARLELLADLAGDVARGDRGDRVAREVPEILRIPERELLHGAVVDVLLHLARQPEAGE